MSNRVMAEPVEPVTSIAADSSSAHSARKPRQLRGQVRVNSILEAAAEAVIEEGLSGVSMHDLARRSKTSIGSLYHFFPDKDSVINALFEKHRAACREIGQQFEGLDQEVWRQLSTAAVIDRLVTPYMDYLRRHADYIPVSCSRKAGDTDIDFIRAIRLVLDARLPQLSPSEREAYATMLHAAGAGAMWLGFQIDPSKVHIYLREIPRLLTVYLVDIEATAEQRYGR